LRKNIVEWDWLDLLGEIPEEANVAAKRPLGMEEL